MNRKFTGLLLALLTVAAGTLSAEQRIVVQTGHIGQVTALAVDSKDSLLFSGGADGTVRAWDVATHELAYTLQVGNLPIRLLAVDPTRPEIAVFETDNINVYRLQVWNWRTGKLLYTRDLSETPLLLQYSPSGDFLVYSITAWNSLTFLDASTGQVLPYFANGFGIVSALIVSSNGKRMMTYSPSGELQYWNIETGALLQSYATLPNLTAMSFTSNNRYMFAASGANLVMIDLIGGQTVSSISSPGIQATAVDPSSNSVAVSTSTGQGEGLSFFSYSGMLFNQGGAFSAPPSGVLEIAFSNGTLYAGLSSGEIYAAQPYLGGETFGGNNLLAVGDFAVSNGRLVLTTPNNLVVFKSSLFGSGDPSSPPSESLVANPYAGKTGISALPDGSFAIWNMEGSTGSYRLFSLSTGIGAPLGSFSSPLVQLESAGSSLLTLDAGGTVRLVDPLGGGTLFEYSASGLDTAASVNATHIMTGLSESGPVNTPLLQINTQTGETVPIPDPSIVVYSVKYDPVKDLVFSLGITTTPLYGSASTVLDAHQLGTLGNGTQWLSYSGEDHNAGLAIDPSNGDVYTSLGFRGVQRLSNADSKPFAFERSGHLPRKIVVSGQWVYSLNSDSTISIWAKATGRLVLTLYIFKNDSWAAILPSGKFFSSSAGAERYLRVFSGSRPDDTPLSTLLYHF